MRRKEFTINEAQEIDEFLAEATYGFLGTIGTDGWPHVIPLNFVWHEGCLYFHGSKIGQKITDLKASERVTFSVAKEYALIPSYFVDPKLACPATAFFKSVMIRGRAEIVTEATEKAPVFTAFMAKLQPEGGYDPIDAADPEYLKNLNGVAVVKIVPEEVSAKFKFGQNLKDAGRDKIEQGLQTRSGEMDAETLDMMKKYCPAHRDTL
jgi:uncharacterized protein